MKVVLLSGSPRKQGNTVQALNQCAEVIRQEGLDAQVISWQAKTSKAAKPAAPVKNWANVPLMTV